MDKKREFKFEGNEVSFTDTLIMGSLEEKLQKGIDEIKEAKGKETNVTMTLDDLYYMRRLLITQAFSTRLARENLVDAMEYTNSLK
ncbi:TPA: hypothetical protein ACGW65_000948 [Bacillus paranthracis]